MMKLGAQAITATVDLLGRFPGAPLTIEREGNSIEIVPSEPNTFRISVYDQGEEAMVSAERWHSHYDDPMQVAFGVLWLLTPYYRVVHELKGGVLVAVWLERYEETGWEGFDPVYFLNPEHPESWELSGDERYARRYIQQGVLPSPEPYEGICPGAKLDEQGLPPDFHPGTRVVYGDRSLGVELFEG